MTIFILYFSCKQGSKSELFNTSTMKNQEEQALLKPLKVSSPAFASGELIPINYTCDGADINPALDISDIPEQTKCLALIVDDPDAPVGIWVHWVVWNIPISQHLKENYIPGKEGLNDFKKHHYGGPCPPYGTHRYFFNVFALDNLLDLPDHTTKMQLENAMNGHILSKGEHMGLYQRSR
jgi:Raf kinase inhibitor-like YbhB/YbcL family protein